MPCFVIPEENGEARILIDYKAFNAIGEDTSITSPQFLMHSIKWWTVKFFQNRRKERILSGKYQKKRYLKNCIRNTNGKI